MKDLDEYFTEEDHSKVIEALKKKCIQGSLPHIKVYLEAFYKGKRAAKEPHLDKLLGLYP
mgnify:CR=1 FL=1